MLVAQVLTLTVIQLILLETCVRSKEIADFDKIVGGRAAAEDEFPFQASLQKRSKFGYFHTCGAVVVSAEWLVTAAHCIQSNKTSTYKIMVGSNTLKPVLAENFYSIRMIIIKKGFLNFHNDIALIQLTSPVRNFKETIKLPDSEPERNTTAFVIGWGATSEGGSASPDLQVAEVVIILRDDCLAYYNEEDLTESMMCAGYPEGGIDACQGDSGGPLVQVIDEEVYLVGIVSWGVGCAEPNYPGVYTNVALFTSWIQHYIAPEE